MNKKCFILKIKHNITIEIFFSVIFPVLIKYNIKINKISEYFFNLIDPNTIIFLDDNDSVVYDKLDKYSDLTPEEMEYIENIHLNGYIGIHEHEGIYIIKIKEVNKPRCGYKKKSIDTNVNNQITDSISNPNVDVLGTAPAIAMAVIYTSIAQSINSLNN